MNEEQIRQIVKSMIDEQLNPHIEFQVVRDEHREHPDLILRLPEKGSSEAVAYDVFSPVDVTIQPGETVKITTDMKVKFPSYLGMLMNVRSSMGAKHGVNLAYGQGWIESDYYGCEENDGNIGVTLVNNGRNPYHIKAGCPKTGRIAQVMFVRKYDAVNGNTNRKRLGGTGSTNEVLAKEV